MVRFILVNVVVATMPKFKVRAKKMSDANVTHISLVDRGANRIPFKIIKQEKPAMSRYSGLDLGTLFTQKSDHQEEVQAPAKIMAVVTMKGEGFESVKSQIEAAGFSTDAMQEEEDGSVIFKQDEEEIGEDSQVIRVNEHVALVTKGFRPYQAEMSMGEGVTFAEACTAQGFYPGIQTIVNVLSSAIHRAVENSESPAAASKAVNKMFDEAKAYTASFLKDLPAGAFKLNSIDGSVTMKSEDETAEVAAEVAAPEVVGDIPNGDGVSSDPVAKSDSPTDVDQGSVPVEAIAESEPAPQPAATPVVKEEAPGPKALTEEAVSSIVATQMEEVTKAFTGALEAVMDKVQKSVTTSQEALAATIGDLSARVEKAETVAKGAEEAIAGVVVVGSETGDPTPTVRKNESSGVFGGRDIDTAFMPQVRKRSRR